MQVWGGVQCSSVWVCTGCGQAPNNSGKVVMCGGAAVVCAACGVARGGQRVNQPPSIPSEGNHVPRTEERKIHIHVQTRVCVR